MRNVAIREDDHIDRMIGNQGLEIILLKDRNAVRVQAPRQYGGYRRPAISGIWVAVNATTL